MITFSTCFYIIKSKFDVSIYIQWMNNLLSIVNHFNLVIYCDEHSSQYIHNTNNHRIKIIIKPIEQFYNYQYKNQWIQNHMLNNTLNTISCWELNMLWSEKIQFVKETFERNYFQSDLYGWCDVGYFRNRKNDTSTKLLSNWCLNIEEIIIPTKIYYACINNNDKYMNHLDSLVNNVHIYTRLPIKQLPPNQQSIAGGFFILHKNNISWWACVYDTMLKKYFDNHYLVKDDQVILANCILSNSYKDKFILLREETKTTDNWFMFQRLLLPSETNP